MVCCAASAQDSTRTRPVMGQITERDYDLGNIRFTPPDSGMNLTEIYNPVRQKYPLYQDEGNIGSPAQSLVFSPERQIGFQLGTQAPEAIFFRPEESVYYQVRRPITNIQYVQGAKELLFLKILHTQNIRPRWNAGVSFRRISSLGFYANQRTSVWNTRLFTSYHSRNQHYQLLASLTWNKGFLEENGGVISDSAFEAVTSVNKQVATNLQGLTVSGGGGPRNYFRNTALYAKQYWNLGKHTQEISDKDTFDRLVSTTRLAHTLLVERRSWLYRDNSLLNKSYYPAFYFDTTRTYDSISVVRVQNTISLFTGPNARNGGTTHVLLAPALRHEYIEVAQRSLNNVYNNLLALFDVQNAATADSRLNYHAGVQYCFSGYNNTDMKAEETVTLRWTDFSVEQQLRYQKWTPDYVLNRFVSNHYVWANNFSQTTLQQAVVKLRTSGLRHNLQVSATHNNLNNYVYSDQNATPRQLSKTISVTVVELSKTLQAGNFYLSNNLWFQQASDKTVLRLPAFGAFERFWYQRRMFKKATTTQLGFDLYYNSSYYAQSFQPVTRQFVLQDSVKTGDYVLVDLFANLQIKRAVLFFKLEHANAGLWGNRYYSSPHQPLPGRAFRMGVVWRMFD